MISENNFSRSWCRQGYNPTLTPPLQAKQVLQAVEHGTGEKLQERGFC